MKYILGTASFDSNYGITKRNDRTSNSHYLDILTEARALSIESLDTAPNYGNAQALIGKYHTVNKPFSVYSKISDFKSSSYSEVIDRVIKSLEQLNIEKFAGLFFHKSEFLDIYSEKITASLINEILSSELATKVGVSVYQESEIDQISRKFPQIRLYQVPENVMDRRLLNSKVVSNLSQQGVEFHLRSIFLQGLLFMDINALKERFSEELIGIRELNDFCQSQRISVLDLCLNYVNQIDWASGIVVGVNSADQLPGIINFKKRSINFNHLPAPLEERILDPRVWLKK
jgi:aryl-alcohol dehydrogenase-like predicted oxidoreductase